MRRFFDTPTWVLLGVIGIQLIVLVFVLGVNYSPEISNILKTTIERYNYPKPHQQVVAEFTPIDQSSLIGASISGTTTQAAKFFTTPTQLYTPITFDPKSYNTTSASLTPFAELDITNFPTQTNITNTISPTDSELSPTPTKTSTQVPVQGFTPASTSTPGPSATQNPAATNTLHPSNTPVPTFTQVPTSTHVPTSTNVPTSTLVPTSTPTTPATATSSPTSNPTRTATAQPSPTATATRNPTTTPTSPPPSPTATSGGPSPTPTVDLGGCFYNTQSWIEYEVLDLINQERLAAGVPALIMNNQLRNSAREHSADMACNSFVSHTGSNGTSSYQRIRGHGYYPSRWGENIYMGWGTTPQTVMNWWMNSAPHTANILSPYYVHIGVGHALYGNNVAYTLNFGSP